MTAKYVSAVLFVKDMQASKRLYSELVGQEISDDFGVNVGYRAGFAIWQVDSAGEVIGQQSTRVPGPSQGSDVELYFESDDLEGVASSLASEGVRFVHPIVEQPWGQRAFRVYDPDGHIVEFGEPMPPGGAV